MGNKISKYLHEAVYFVKEPEAMKIHLTTSRSVNIVADRCCILPILRHRQLISAFRKNNWNNEDYIRWYYRGNWRFY